MTISSIQKSPIHCGWGDGSRSGWRDRALAVIGGCAYAFLFATQLLPTALNVETGPDDAAASTAARSGSSSGSARPASAAGTEWAIGGYGGVAYTHPSAVRFVNPGRTDMTVKDFGWIGRPFKAPIYYGVRIQRWGSNGQFGSMLDFTHAKAIAQRDDIATFEGTLNGETLPSKQRMGDVFRHLEFSHGHNMLTLNGMARLAPAWSRFRPYVGAGAGISLPHTEIGIHSERARTYEYHFAGFVGQALAGLEIQLGRTSVFFEYKFTYAPYDVPLSHEPYGWLLVTDLWRQFSAWWNGEAPPGGRASTTLISHHGIAGAMLRSQPGPVRLANDAPPSSPSQ
ncbi:MAG: hypothetical protein ACR2PG_20635 [Hyphomicrobiaceae bacterium]